MSSEPVVNTELDNALDRLRHRYLRDFPTSAARQIEALPLDEALAEICALPAAILTPVWQEMSADRGAALLCRLPPAQMRDLTSRLTPTDAVRFLLPLQDGEREALLDTQDAELAASLRALMSWPEHSAGRLMDGRIPTFRPDTTAAAALERLRALPGDAVRSVYVVDGDNRLSGQVPIQNLAVAMSDTCLGELATPVRAAVNALDPREEVIERAEQHRLTDVPVIDLDGRMIGLIQHDRLMQAMQQDVAADIGAMVGVSPQERALSTPWFAVKKRLPWLQVNLLTAFLAASVVGLFENTIAQFTALAVLLPVVAGQSGNAGSQALAVTIRGLALREVTVRQWFAVMSKEVGVGLANGLAVAVTCGLGVAIWSGSVGLVLVICISMVLAMVMAGFSGAVVPMLLTRFGQDPAQASSIILTTVTDIAGFFSFLGIATVLSGML